MPQCLSDVWVMPMQVTNPRAIMQKQATQVRIPTCVGSIMGDVSKALCETVHPHMRGEYLFGRGSLPCYQPNRQLENCQAAVFQCACLFLYLPQVTLLIYPALLV